MPSFPLLDIAIGLIFIYLLLSLVCSSLSEGLESFLRNRASDLERGIRNLLGDEPGSWWKSFLPWVSSIEKKSIAREFYDHPLVRNLFGKETKLPTYIPARNFALAVMDMVAKDGALLRGSTSNLSSSANGVTPLADKVNEILIPDRLRLAVSALATAANGDAQQVRINIETWFNSSMDRVSGGYKSRTQKILFCLGAAVTLGLNADSIAIFQLLSHSKNLQAVVGAAQSTVGEKAPSNPDLVKDVRKAVDQLNRLNLGLGWDNEADQSGTLDRGRLPPNFRKSGCKTETWPCQDPIGWTFHLLYLHGIGWLITAAAISLGAPFWFDTLNRFVVVRSTVKPQEKSPEEGSKDRSSKP